MHSTEVKIIEKHSLILRLTHWLNVPLLLIMIWSGILIYWAHQAYFKIPNMVGPFQVHHRLAEGMGWHFFIMWPFVLNGFVYIFYQVFSGQWKELIPNRKTFRDLIPFLLHEFKIKKDLPVSHEKFNPAQKLAYTGAILMGLGTLITGIAIYKPVQLGWLTAILGGYKAARLEHFVLMCGFVIFIFIHIVQVIRAGWNNFRAMVAGYEIK